MSVVLLMQEIVASRCDEYGAMGILRYHRLTQLYQPKPCSDNGLFTALRGTLPAAIKLSAQPVVKST